MLFAVIKPVGDCNWFTLEFIFSTLAIVVSVLAFVFEIIGNFKINNINLEAEYVRIIFNPYLLNEIPMCRERIKHDGKKVLETKVLAKKISDMRRDALIYKWKDSKFYNKLKSELQALEDELSKHLNKEMSKEDYLDFERNINEKLSRVYRMIEKKYQGKNS